MERAQDQSILQGDESELEEKEVRKEGEAAEDRSQKFK